MMSLSPLKRIRAPRSCSWGTGCPPEWTETTFQVPWSSSWAFLRASCFVSSAASNEAYAHSLGHVWTRIGFVKTQAHGRQGLFDSLHRWPTVLGQGIGGQV